MNNIDEQQNSNNILALQYSAHTYYNKAEVLNYLAWIISIVCAVACLLKVQFFIDYSKIIGLILSLVIVALQLLITKYIRIAAASRRFIDHILFNFKQPDTYNGYAKEKLYELAFSAREKNPNKAAIYYKNTGTDLPRGAKDWYSDINPSDNNLSAILACQRQNTGWDKRLTNIYIYLYFFFVVSFFIIIVISSLHNTLLSIIFLFASISSILIKLIWAFIGIVRYRQLSISIDTLLDTVPKRLTLKYVKGIQDRIDQRRNMPIITSNFLHDKFSERYHKVFSRNSFDKDI